MSALNISNFIWSIADDVLRDVYVRGKYRDVILPMTVIRRLDAALEPTKAAVTQMRELLDKAKITNQHAALCEASGEAFYNSSPFRLRDLASRSKPQALESDFNAYLDGFSANVQEVLDQFQFRKQISKLVGEDALGFLIEKFLDPSINLSPKPVLNSDGSVRLPGLDNHSMGTIFEELIRRFNEENNEEAGEHFTPRDVVSLMTSLVFMPVADAIESGTYLIYDGACGTGGMLTVAEETLIKLAVAHDKEVSVHLFGQEVNAETWAIAKADLILKGEGAEADNLARGSTLSADAFPAREFDFMLSNPPYGKSWKTDLERLGGKKGIRDPRFAIRGDNPEYSLVTRSNDGQMLFLVNMLSKMKVSSPLGSRIAEVHNGSSLFTGDAGTGESNIRRWIIENDYLEAVVALPQNIFYNTGIATYIWVLSNRKAPERRGKVQLIDATGWFTPLKKNLGRKNCALSDGDIERICESFLELEKSENSKILPNEAFGFWKVTIERPLRLRVDLDGETLQRFRNVCLRDSEMWLYDVIDGIANKLGAGPHMDFNGFLETVESAANSRFYLAAKLRKLLKGELGRRDPKAKPVLKISATAGAGMKRYDSARADTSRIDVADYEPDPELRDTERVPVLEDGGIKAFFQREVLPYAPDAWIDASKTEVGYEVSFTQHFYKPKPLRPLKEIESDLRVLERKNHGILDSILMAENR